MSLKLNNLKRKMKKRKKLKLLKSLYYQNKTSMQLLLRVLENQMHSTRVSLIQSLRRRTNIIRLSTMVRKTVKKPVAG